MSAFETRNFPAIMFIMASARETLLKKLAVAALNGNLGLLVGSGFTKALTGGAAPTWIRLLECVADEVGAPQAQLFEDARRNYHSPPEVASDIVAWLESQGVSRGDAVARVKNEAAKMVATLSLAQGEESRFRAELARIRPAWVATTNYDSAIEAVLDSCESLLPNQAIRARRDSVPVLHLHGHCLLPDTLVLTSEDYVHAIATFDYRSSRLATLFAESTVLALGYALGDVNIKSARHHAAQFRLGDAIAHAEDQGKLVIADYQPGTSGEVYEQEDATVVGIANLGEFLSELGTECDSIGSSYQQSQANYEGRLRDGTFSDRFMGEEKFRRNLVRNLTLVPGLISGARLVAAVEDALRAAGVRAMEPKAFNEYKAILSPILDLLALWPIGQFPPRLLEVVMGNFAAIAPLITQERYSGAAWDASNLWYARRAEVLAKPHVRTVLEAYAQRAKATALTNLLREN